MAESTRRSAGHSRAKFRLGLFEQPFVDTGAVHVHTRTAAQLELARQVAATASCSLKNDGCCRSAERRAPSGWQCIGPNAASARNLLGDYSYLAHVESLLDLLKSGDNVFAMPLDHGADVDDELDLAHVGNVLDELRRAAAERRRRARRRVRRQQRRPVGVRRRRRRGRRRATSPCS